MATLQAPQYGQNTDIDSGAAEVLTTDTIRVAYGTEIKALAANGSNYVYVGITDDVSATTGWQLAAGDSIFVSVREAQYAGDIYVIGSADNQKVCWRAI